MTENQDEPKGRNNMPITVPTQGQIEKTFKDALSTIPNACASSDHEQYDRIFRSLLTPTWSQVAPSLESLRVSEETLLARIGTKFIIENHKAGQLQQATKTFNALANTIRDLMPEATSIAMTFSPTRTKSIPFGMELELMMECVIQK